MNAPTDEKLLKEFLAGQEASFELLVRRHTPELYQFVLRFTNSVMAAEDVVQETFVQVYSSAGKFDPQRRFKPWLFTIAANKARDYLRSRNRKREVPIDALVATDGESNKRFVDLLASETLPVDEELQYDEKRRVVREVVASMPETLREVLVLAYFHHLSYKEIAEIHEIPLGTVKSRLHSAVVQFGERYRVAVQQQEEKRTKRDPSS